MKLIVVLEPGDDIPKEGEVIAIGLQDFRLQLSEGLPGMPIRIMQSTIGHINGEKTLMLTLGALEASE